MSRYGKDKWHVKIHSIEGPSLLIDDDEGNIHIAFSLDELPTLEVQVKEKAFDGEPVFSTKHIIIETDKDGYEKVIVE